ncbi:NAD(P)-dependent oxidoreductase [Kineococcus indalonis]|uniref:NAD(P)-dependent oxidoreductase n=1 Tax=Kineococcus indalonis TaxID=2696566 RepID=UPI001411D2CB|nr:NAD(P)-dependent oxidoreductase [Kineococcus indalonis]NAZ85006.1 NAD-binding protein [Kineococcus indalonis]
MAASPGTTTVGFAGLGNIGRPMASALLRAGWSLTVFDRDPARARGLDGARVVQEAAGLAGCEVLLLAVPDDEAVESLLDGPGGWFAAGGPGRTAVVHSTVMPRTAARLADVAAEHGAGLLDAPVSGGADRAEEGDLTIMAGGDADVLERVRPLLQDEGSQVLHVGPAGAGAATKLANQLMMLSALAGVHEALDLAAAHGVEAGTVFEAVASSTGDSWVARNWGFFDRTVAAYDAAGTARSERPWSKDLFEVVAAARACDLRVPVAGLLAQVLADRVEAHAAQVAAGGGGR